MCTRMRILIGVLALMLMCNPLASAEVLNVSSLSADGVWTQVLESGTVYQLTASGTWIASMNHHNAYGTGIVDAEWHLGGFDPNGPWVEFPGGEYTDLFVNDREVDWLGSSDGVTWAPHVFSPTHVYRYYYTGMGTPIHLFITDTEYWDNSGYLTVEVAPIPEPATFWLLALGGLAIMTRAWHLL